MRPRLLLLLFAIGAFASTMAAQSEWTAVPSGTANNLWGGCFGGGQFVVVGENGTLLTSPDGLAWTARNAGTARWLLAAAYSPELQRYVVVGDQGLVLTSSDAIAWTPRTSGTSQRLNGVAFGGGKFVAVGEAGTACTSADGLTWTAANVPRAGWLRGIAFGAGRFVICGQAGTVSPQQASVWTTTDGAQFDSGAAAGLDPGADLEAAAFDGTRFAVAGVQEVALAAPNASLNWQRKFAEVFGVSTPPFHHFRGVTFFNNTWIAVGALSSASTSNSPIVYAQPNERGWQQVTQLPASAALNAIAADPGLNGGAIAVGQGGLILRATPTKAEPEPFLASTSSTIITVAGRPVELLADARGSLPLSYQWNFNGAPIVGANQPALVLGDSPPAFLRSGDYTLTVTGLGNSGPITVTSNPYHVIVVSPLALTAPVDPNFSAALPARPSAFAVQPDGRILVSGPTQPNGQPAFGFLRLNPDGSRDASFQPSARSNVSQIELTPDGHILLNAGGARLNADGTADSAFTPLPTTSGHIVLPDGSIVTATIENNQLRFSVYNADGTPASVAAAPYTLAPSPAGSLDPSYSSVLFTPFGLNAGIGAAVSHQQVGTGAFFEDETTLFRYSRFGVDPFSPVVKLPVAFDQFVGVGDKLYFVSHTTGPLGASVSYHTGRLNADLTIDPTYRSATLSGGIPVFPLVRLASDGSVYFAASNTNTIVRYTPEGLLDAEFSARFSSPVTFSGLLPIEGGRLLVSGDFTGLNGSTSSYLARLVPDTHASATRLTNLSVRQFAGTGSQTLIVGFVVSGQGTKSMLLRGVGPTLANFQLSSPLADPKLALLDRSGAELLANDNWSDNANAAAIAASAATSGAFALPNGSKDAAALAALPAGAFTMQIGVTGSGGVALAEGYDTSGEPADYTAARVVNFSARATAGAGEETLIAGFTISGPNVKRVLVRAVGPGLRPFGIADALPDPQLTVYSGTTAIAANDDWSGGDLSAAFSVTGAFPLATKDAALLLTLPPGSYTVQVASSDRATTGTALVEVYELP